MNQDLTPANVSPEELNKIRALEAEIGKVVVAVEPPPQVAKLTREQLNQLRQIEQEMGVVMVAYRDQN